MLDFGGVGGTGRGGTAVVAGRDGVAGERGREVEVGRIGGGEAGISICSNSSRATTSDLEEEGAAAWGGETSVGGGDGFSTGGGDDDDGGGLGVVGETFSVVETLSSCMERLTVVEGRFT